MNSARKLRRLSKATDGAIRLDRMWESIRIGLYLTESFYKGERGLTVKMVSMRLDMPQDTVRRRLDALVRINRALIVRSSGRSVLYRAHPRWAQETCLIVNGLTD